MAKSRHQSAVFWTLAEATVAFTIIFVAVFGFIALPILVLTYVLVPTSLGSLRLAIPLAIPIAIAAPIALASARWQWRRSKAHRPCDHCGYELHKRRKGTCPECGTPFHWP